MPKYVWVRNEYPKETFNFAATLRAFTAGLIGSVIGALLWIPIGYIWHLFAAIGAAIIFALCMKLMDVTGFDRPFIALPFAIVQTLIAIITGSFLFTAFYMVKYGNIPIDFQLPGSVISNMLTDTSFLNASLQMGAIGIFSVSVIYLSIKFGQNL